MRKLIVVAISACALAVLAAGATAAKPIKVGDDYYVRPSGVPKVTVSKGTTVRWRFVGDNLHSVTVSKGPVKFSSGVKSSAMERLATAAPASISAIGAAPGPVSYASLIASLQ